MYEGLFAHYLHIRPWEWDLLEVEQAKRLIDFVEHLQQE